MRIGFDATPILQRKSGIGYYSENLVRALGELSEEEILLFSNREPVFEGEPPTGLRWIPRGTFSMRALWMQFRLPSLVAAEKIDLMHYANFNAPALAGHPYVVTFHDMVLYKHPEFFTWKKRVLTRRLMPWVAQRARGIIAVTHQIKKEIVADMGIDPEKVFVVQNAAGESFAPVEKTRIEAIRKRHGLERPYVLFVGTLEPRKNLARLLEAFDRARAEDDLPHDLVVVGGRGWKFGPIFQTMNELAEPDRIRFLDYVDLEDLPAIYGGADLFAFPSIYEGFGIPIVEAMKCDTAVLASDIPVHREVLGNTGFYCDPLSVSDIAQALGSACKDANARVEKSRLGLERSKDYSWKRAARETLEVYRAVLSGKGSSTLQ